MKMKMKMIMSGLVQACFGHTKKIDKFKLVPGVSAAVVVVVDDDVYNFIIPVSWM